MGTRCETYHLQEHGEESGPDVGGGRADYGPCHAHQHQQDDVDTAVIGLP